MDTLISSGTQSAPEPVAQPEPAPATEQKPEDTPQYWKARYVGADRKMGEFKQVLTQKENEYKSVTTGLVEKLTVAEQKAMELERQLQSVAKEKDDYFAKFQEVDKRAATLAAARERDKIIGENFPHLAPYQAKGLLKEEGFGSNEDYMKYLDSFSQTLTGIQRDAIRRDLIGTVPPATPEKNAGVPTKEVLWDQMNAALKSKDFKLAAELEKQLAFAK